MLILSVSYISNHCGLSLMSVPDTLFILDKRYEITKIKKAKIDTQC